MVGPLTASALILLVAAISGTHMLPIRDLHRGCSHVSGLPGLSASDGQGVELHPLLVLFGVFAGAEVAGIPGHFFLFGASPGANPVPEVRRARLAHAGT